MTFIQVLRKHGFKRLLSPHKGTTCMGVPRKNLYAEVYTETWGRWCWVAGDGVPSSGYPGGKAYHEPHVLDETLRACLE